MTGILELSNEILLMVVSYVQPRPPVSLAGRPFHVWSQALREHDELAFRQAKLLNGLVRACRRFHIVFNPVLYAYVPLLDQPDSVKKLGRSMENNPELCSYIKHASLYVPWNDFPYSFPDFLLNFPKVDTMDLQGYTGSDGRPCQSRTHGSNIKVLRLIECGAQEACLIETLSLLPELKELWYEVADLEWDGHFEEGETVPGFSCKAVQRVLEKQGHELEKFVMTREDPSHESLGYSVPLNLRNLRSLRNLSINHVYLVGEEHDVDMSRHLPPSLEELEIYYDDIDYISFIHYDPPRPTWLMKLLQQAKDESDGRTLVYTPALKRIRIVSLEFKGWAEPDFERGEVWDLPDDGPESQLSPTGMDMVRLYDSLGPSWKPPKALLAVFQTAQISFSIFLHQQMRCSYAVEAGQGFLDQWEDTWVPS